MVAAFLMQEFAAGAHEGDRKRMFEREVMPLFDPLYGHALKLTRKPADAEDLVQDTLLRAFRSFHQYRPGTNLRAWLYRIMMNTYISGWRRKRRSPEQANFDDVKDLVPDSRNLMAEKGAYIELGDRLALDDFKQQLDGRLKDAMEALPDEYREVLILSAIDDFAYKEISEVLDIPIGTVMSRLSRAKAMIRDALNAAPDAAHKGQS